MPSKNTNSEVISLNGNKQIKAAVVLSEVTLVRLVDLPGQRIVRAFIKELGQPLTLWEGDAYDEAGDWTQAEANARILGIINDPSFSAA